MNLQKVFKQVVWVLFIAALLLGVPRLGGLAADQFDYSAVDPDGAFAWISVHHIVQALIVLIIMVVIRKVSAIRFGFGWGDRKVGLLYVRVLALIFAAYAVVSVIIMVATGSWASFPYPFTPRNVAGQLGFQLLLSGPSEELIFRAFGITMLALVLKGAVFGGETGIGKSLTTVIGGELTVANLITAVLFGLAHLRITFVPFSLSYSTFQVFYSMVLGLFYGVCYERSESMVYPMIMHSITNVLAVGVLVIAELIVH